MLPHFYCCKNIKINHTKLNFGTLSHVTQKYLNSGMIYELHKPIILLYPTYPYNSTGTSIIINKTLMFSNHSSTVLYSCNARIMKHDP